MPVKVMTSEVIDGSVPGGYNEPFAQAIPMRFLVPLVLLIVALIHALPLAGVVGAPRLQQLYGLAVEDPQWALLLRHRAVLFGLLAGFLAYAAFRPELHAIGVLGGLVSVGSFVALASSVTALNEPLSRVVRVDLGAMALLVMAALVLLYQRFITT